MESKFWFRYDGYDVDPANGRLDFHYSYSNGPEFKESIDFCRPFPKEWRRSALVSALRNLGLLIGISYYKAFCPNRIILGEDFSKSELAFHHKLYLKGLGEFAWRNGLDLSQKINFEAKSGSFVDEGEWSQVGGNSFKDTLKNRAAVLLGGGKDSLVSVELMRHMELPFCLFAVNPKGPILETAKASDIDLLSVRRTIDPQLFRLNNSGAYNGHVPITAIVSMIAVCAAFIQGFDTIILSNERSANEGNLEHDGVVVNHQYSKTLECERDLQQFIHDRVSADLACFSLLRPLSELHIARLFTHTKRYDHSFTSCNRAFVIEGHEQAKRWCGDCPKCRFAALILASAPQMTPQRLYSIQGHDLLDDAAQLEGYEALCGLSGHKPWDCVGEIRESAVAMIYLYNQPAWKGKTVVHELAPRLLTRIPKWMDVLDDLLTPSPHHALPEAYRGVLHDWI